MNSKKIGLQGKRRVALAILTLLLFAAAAAAVFGGVKPAYANEIISEKILEEYSLNARFTLPETVDIRTENDGVLTGKNGVLVFPNGTARTGSVFSLTEVGEYKAIYRAESGGKTYFAEKTFKAHTGSWVISSSRTEAAYKTGAEGDAMYENVSDAGILVSLADGDTFSFKIPVNVNELAEENGNLINVIRAYPIIQQDPSLAPAATTFTVKLVDYYDDANYLEFTSWKDKTSGVYMSAGAGCQDLTALDDTTSRKDFTYNGISGTLRHITRYSASYTWGKYCYGNLNGIIRNGGISFYYNVVNGEVREGAKAARFITNVKSQAIYGENTFKGFTTGEAYVVIECKNYSSASIDICIAEILGLKGEALKNVAVKDDVSPTVKVDAELTDENGVYLSVGRSYVLPSVKVTDVNYAGDCSVRVYYNYGTENVSEAKVTDGIFTPDKPGQYTAVYTAKDLFGNSGTATLVMGVTRGNAFNYEKVALEALTAGEECEIPAVSVTGINKAVRTEVTAKDPAGGIINITDSLSGGAYRFVPEYVGEYEIIFNFTDNVYTETNSYKVNAKDEGKVTFDGEPELPSAFIKNATYDLGDYSAYVATEKGFVSHACSVEASSDGGEFVKVANPYAYKVTANESVRFRFGYNGAYYLDKERTIYDLDFEGTKRYGEYFYGYESYASENTSINYAFTSGGATLNYITPFAFNAFSVDFEIPAGVSYDEISICVNALGGKGGYVLSYKRETSSSVNVKISSLSGTVYYSATRNGAFYGVHSVAINANTLTTGEGVSVKLPATGSEFAEFGFKIPTTADGDVIKIKKVCGQAFSGRMRETAITLVYQKPVTTTYVGSTYVMPKFTVSNALYPMSERALKITVKLPSGDVAEDVNGEFINKVYANGGVSFKLAEIGTYTATFEYTGYSGSINGRFVNNRYMITAFDNVAPEITFDGVNENSLVKLRKGGTHKIKSFTVKDNYSSLEELTVKVIVLDAKDNVIAWGVEEEFRFDKAGYYKVMVFCQDADGNYSTAYYNVLAE